MIMVIGTEGFSNAGNNNCDRTREKEKESERRKRERERCGEGNSASVGALEEEDPGDDGRTDGRDGRDGKKYSIFSKLVHFFISLVNFSSIAKPKST
jgi:hypothetical protein